MLVFVVRYRMIVHYCSNIWGQYRQQSNFNNNYKNISDKCCYESSIHPKNLEKNITVYTKILSKQKRRQ